MQGQGIEYTEVVVANDGLSVVNPRTPGQVPHRGAAEDNVAPESEGKIKELESVGSPSRRAAGPFRRGTDSRSTTSPSDQR